MVRTISMHEYYGHSYSISLHGGWIPHSNIMEHSYSMNTDEIIRRVPSPVPNVPNGPNPRPTPTIPNNLSSIKRAMIVGCGGIGANLALVLAKEGYDLLLIDHDTIEEKNLKRLVFSNGNLSHYIGKHKTELLRNLIKQTDVSAKVETEPIKFESCIDSSRLASWMTTPFVGVCCADTKDARLFIESRLKKAPQCKFFLHVGCNLNSVSLFPSVQNVISSSMSGASSSYDVEPDPSTYMVCTSTVLRILKNNAIEINNSFMDVNISNGFIRPSYPVQSPIDHNTFVPPVQTVDNINLIRSDQRISIDMYVWLDLVRFNGQFYETLNDIKRQTLTKVRIDSHMTGHNVRVNRADYYNAPFLNPHRFSSDGTQCIGSVKIPCYPQSDFDCKQFLYDVGCSLRIANMDSAASQKYDNFVIDAEFVNRYCRKTQTSKIL